MNLLRREFPDLRKRFPVETWFADAMIEESIEQGDFSLEYWENGKDQDGKVLSAAFQFFSRLGGERKQTDAYDEWMQRALVGGSKFLTPSLIANYEQSFAENRTAWSAGLGWFARPQADLQMSEFMQRMNGYLATSQSLPTTLPGPSLALLENTNPSSFSPEELRFISSIFVQISPSTWPKDGSVDTMVGRTLAALAEADDLVSLRAMIKPAWAIARFNNNGRLVDRFLDVIKKYAKEEEFELVANLGGPGLDIAGEILSEGQRRDLESLLASARSTMGPTIGVPSSDPRFPVFAAQQNWTIGRTQGAWDMLSGEGVDELLRDMVGDLNPDFMLWAVAEYSRRDQLETADLLSVSINLVDICFCPYFSTISR